MKVRRTLVAAGSLLAVAVLVRCLPTVGQQSDWDVRGNYDLAYDNQLTLKLDLAGAVREATASGYGKVVDFGTYNGQPLTLDLSAFCAKPEVVCPGESLWKKVAIDEDDVTKAQNVHGVQVVNNEQRDLPLGEKAQTLGGLVAREELGRYQLLVGLGGSGGASGNCAALGISLAGGRFTHAGEETVRSTAFRTPSGKACGFDGGFPALDAGDAGDAEPCQAVEVSRIEYPEGATVNGIAEGRIFVGYLGACAFGPIVAAATLTIETGFTGNRTGAFDPPPFTPAEPVTIDPSDAGQAEPPDAALAEPPDATLAEPPDAAVVEISDAGARD
ncbi:MAG TPA: hypothetical protein VGK67_08860 [Myxococcales bacterium]|jgi:hypothetical protein